ncbi:unnamed protein product [Cyclocybe aegerita]|uniref:ABC1 atypical kinase-like domain-containing protein n=1 Tax=Cyclocybe aegerita TaxID=1973307 RepID=A0A8S0WSB3_CYCAE|nr:unnamed protein product [Cyclocybe aegerita]
MVELFSAQMFDWGWVHCDPHPGNVLVRPSPSNPKRAQLVLLDHGLYVRVPEDFKREWVRLWRAMLVGDYKGVEEVTNSWGMGLPDLVASFTLMRPTILRKGRKPKPRQPDEEAQKEHTPLTQYEMSVKMKQKLKEFLTDTDRMPKVLIFLTRNMRMVQGNNQSFGSPVNRVKITGYWASRAGTRHASLGVVERIREWWQHVVFRFAMFTIDIVFWRTRFVFWLRETRAKFRLGGGGTKENGGFEEELERTMRGFAKDNFGLEMGEATFAG